MSSVLWLRRDLRRRDHPALLAAAAAGPVVPLVVLDPAHWEGLGPVRRGWLAATLRATRDEFDGRLALRLGPPTEVVPAVAAEVGAVAVHVTRESTLGGARGDAAVADRLGEAGRSLVETGTRYAVGPGLVRNGTGGPYQVFTPFSRAWRAHGWPAPAADPGNGVLADHPSDPAAWAAVEAAVAACPIPLPPAGEEAARARWAEFQEGALAAYGTDRDRPDVDGSSRLSPHLVLGTVHPRTLLADLERRVGPGPDTFRTELAWREFSAELLWRHPRSATEDLRGDLAGLRYDDPEDAIDAWKTGHTGYPVVDAGQRQLLATGWMHNRVRMITASFLTKDLHVRWQVGARHFLQHLIDADLASNSQSWQWVAGTGSDAAPYIRVFNPVTQGRRFDPLGDYVRRWVPELAHLPGAVVHAPWETAAGYAHGYPRRIVDHAEERLVALARYQEGRAGVAAPGGSR